MRQVASVPTHNHAAHAVSVSVICKQLQTSVARWLIRFYAMHYRTRNLPPFGRRRDSLFNTGNAVTCVLHHDDDDDDHAANIRIIYHLMPRECGLLSQDVTSQSLILYCRGHGTGILPNERVWRTRARCRRRVSLPSCGIW